MAELTQLVERDGVARLTLNRPEARNALSLELIESTRRRVRELAQWDHVNACVVAGAGRAFCAGMDLKAVLDDPRAPVELLTALAELSLELAALPMVTVARVQGAAIGGGCGLVCVCDLSITHAGARLGYPEVDLGVCPAVVAPWLVHRLGAGAARRMLLTGGLLSGEEAHRRGLVTGLTADLDSLDEEVGSLAGRLRDAGPSAIRATKAWLNTMESPALTEQVRRGAMISAEVLSDPVAKEKLRRRLASKRPSSARK